MESTKHYQAWLAYDGLDEDYRKELTGISQEEITDRFFAPLSFGTAGLRGTMGAGINRMNKYTVSQATAGLASALLSLGGDIPSRGVVITHDCRNNSDKFAAIAADILSAAGIEVYITDGMRPTPLLSSTILRLNAAAGINITASHNPKEYNGYKVYWDDGAQISGEIAELVSEHISKTEIFSSAICTPDPSKIHLLGRDNDEAFFEACLSQRVDTETAARSGLKIVFTPFHGTGAAFIPEALRRCGFENIYCVEQQMIPDGNFSTVASPNPENTESFAMAIELAKKVGADVIIGSDPDADRIGMLSPDGKGGYVSISGNQVGVLLADYLINSRRRIGVLPAKSAIVSSIVSTKMTAALAKANGLSYGESFTGFRFIAEIMTELEQEGCTCLMGFEESYGYLIGGHCRDKDAVTAAILISEMASVLHEDGRTVSDRLEELYKEYGCFYEKTINLIMPGIDGIAMRKATMEGMRNAPPLSIGGIPVEAVRDYSDGSRRTASGVEQMKLSGSDVLIYDLADGSSFAIRPSGTEPKIKIYFLICGSTMDECKAKCEAFSQYAQSIKA